MKRNRQVKNWLASLLALRFYRYSTTHNDRILPETRWSAFFLVPFLLAGWIVLTFWPDDTQILFAWSTSTRMTALMLAAVYAGGAFFFSRVYLAHQWHRVALGFIPAIVFSLTGGLVTIIYWDIFNHSAPAFIVWVAVYAIAVWLIPLVWFRNLALDPRMPSVRDVLVPRSLNTLWFFLAAANLCFGGILFFTPDLAAGGWPWPVSQIGTRMIGSFFIMFGLTWVGIAFDRRWSSLQVVLETLAVTFCLVLIGVARSWSDFVLLNPLTWIFIGFIIAILVGICVLYLWVEIR